jgi:hypothetical protein
MREMSVKARERYVTATPLIPPGRLSRLHAYALSRFGGRACLLKRKCA